MIDISGLDRAEVLAALYNASKPLGMGFLHFDPGPMAIEEARSILDRCLEQPFARGYFDYLKGRIMKVDLSRPEFDERLYDRDNGTGAAARALGPLLAVTRPVKTTG